MDFEGSLREGIREAGFIYVVDGKIDYAIEISDDLTDEAQFKSSLIKHFSKNKIRQPLIYVAHHHTCLLYTSPSPRDQRGSRMPSSA